MPILGQVLQGSPWGVRTDVVAIGTCLGNITVTALHVGATRRANHHHAQRPNNHFSFIHVCPSKSEQLAFVSQASALPFLRRAGAVLRVDPRTVTRTVYKNCQENC